jgi:hypothetical protein
MTCDESDALGIIIKVAIGGKRFGRESVAAEEDACRRGDHGEAAEVRAADLAA